MTLQRAPGGRVQTENSSRSVNRLEPLPSDELGTNQRKDSVEPNLNNTMVSPAADTAGDAQPMRDTALGVLARMRDEAPDSEAAQPALAAITASVPWRQEPTRLAGSAQPQLVDSYASAGMRDLLDAMDEERYLERQWEEAIEAELEARADEEAQWGGTPDSAAPATPETQTTKPTNAVSSHVVDQDTNCGLCGRQIEDGDWDDPVPLDAPALPAFPVDALGDGLANFVKAAAASLQVPVDMVAMAALATISCATGGRARVEVKPDWHECTALWLVALADSSERKTPALDVAAKPLRDAEAKLMEDARPSVEEDAQEIRIATVAMEKAEKAAGNADGPARDTNRADAEAARLRLAELGEGRKLPRLLVRDTTLEKLAQLMGEQQGRIGSLATEGGLFKVMAGLYSGGKPANTDLLLEAYTGGAYTVDRIGRPGARMDSTFLSLGLIIQPGVVARLERSNPEFRSTGLLGRFLYSRPTPVAEDVFESPAIPGEVATAYSKAITALVDHVWKAEPFTMTLDEEGRKVFAEFYNTFGQRRKPGGDLYEVADWAGKLRGNLVRIAACLTLYDDPKARTISHQRISDAIALTPYFVKHAKAVFDLMGKDAAGRRKPLREVVAWLRAREKPWADFSERDAWQAMHGRQWANEADDVKQVLQELHGYGWIAPVHVEDTRGKRGRPKSLRYDVHPQIAAHKAHNCDQAATAA